MTKQPRDSSVRRTISPLAHDFSRGALVTALLLIGSTAIAHADAPAAAPTTAPQAASVDEVNAFALGYALEYSHLKAYRFIEDVKALKDVNDDGKAGAMVQDLIVQGETLRKMESDTCRRAADLMSKLDAPHNSVRWADKTALSLAKSIDKGPKGVISEELSTELLSAIIDETGSVQKELISTVAEVQPSLAGRSKDAIWAFNAGSYDAKIRLWDSDSNDIPMLRREATDLIQNEPPSPPVDVDAALQAVLPQKGLPTLHKGVGNLSSLLPGDAADTATVALRAVPVKLTEYFEAAQLVTDLDGQPAPTK